MSLRPNVNRRTATTIGSRGIELAALSRRLFDAGHTEAGVAVAEAARCLGTARRCILDKLGLSEPDEPAPEPLPNAD